MRSCQPKACTTDTLQVTVFVFLWVFSKKKKKKKMKQIRTKDILRFCFPLLQQFLCLSSLVCFPLQATLRLSSLLLLPITGTSVPFDTLPFALHREVAKAVKLRKAKTVVVAPSIEQIESEGGLDPMGATPNAITTALRATIAVTAAKDTCKHDSDNTCVGTCNSISVCDSNSICS